ncbi:hypothetical protein WIS52_18585 [Pseudonocardia nematodicida]|uniref:Guanylate cyclase domain-containing protein n=1 Tax=Pseudonocardia nematodicida TaxID=1206997 RepID=A0ABV1KEA5_9PSEU
MTAVPTHDLPPYRAMLAVDVKDFSSRPGRDHHDLTEEIPGILRAAFARGGRESAWVDDRCFHRSDGDGYVAGFRPAILPFLITTFLSELQNELAERDGVGRGDHRDPIRMRVSINVGPVASSGGNTIADGSGRARIELHRFLDCAAVRQALDRSDPATHVAAIISRHAFDDAVLTGYAGEGAHAYFTPVPVDIPEKKFRGEAYLRVPNATGDLVARGLQPERSRSSGTATDAVDADGPTPQVRTTITNNDGVVHSGIGNLYTRRQRRDR